MERRMIESKVTDVAKGDTLFANWIWSVDSLLQDTVATSVFEIEGAEKMLQKWFDDALTPIEASEQALKLAGIDTKIRLPGASAGVAVEQGPADADLAKALSELDASDIDPATVWDSLGHRERRALVRMAKPMAGAGARGLEYLSWSELPDLARDMLHAKVIGEGGDPAQDIRTGVDREELERRLQAAYQSMVGLEVEVGDGAAYVTIKSQSAPAKVEKWDPDVIYAVGEFKSVYRVHARPSRRPDPDEDTMRDLDAAAAQVAHDNRYWEDALKPVIDDLFKGKADFSVSGAFDTVEVEIYPKGMGEEALPAKKSESSRAHTPKRYKCRECGHETTQTTNHYGPTWSWGRSNACPKCPPYKKYSEFGGKTVWDCVDEPPSNGDPARVSEVRGDADMWVIEYTDSGARETDIIAYKNRAEALDAASEFVRTAAEDAIKEIESFERSQGDDEETEVLKEMLAHVKAGRKEEAVFAWLDYQHERNTDQKIAIGPSGSVSDSPWDFPSAAKSESGEVPSDAAPKVVPPKPRAGAAIYAAGGSGELSNPHDSVDEALRMLAEADAPAGDDWTDRLRELMVGGFKGATEKDKGSIWAMLSKRFSSGIRHLRDKGLSPEAAYDILKKVPIDEADMAAAGPANEAPDDMGARIAAAVGEALKPLEGDSEEVVVDTQPSRDPQEDADYEFQVHIGAMKNSPKPAAGLGTGGGSVVAEFEMEQYAEGDPHRSKRAGGDPDADDPKADAYDAMADDAFSALRGRFSEKAKGLIGDAIEVASGGAMVFDDIDFDVAQERGAEKATAKVHVYYAPAKGAGGDQAGDPSR